MPFSKEDAEVFKKYSRKIRTLSLSLGIPSIAEEEAMILYAITYTYTLARKTSLRIIDAGAGIGYSTIWLAKALHDAGCNICLVDAVEKHQAYAEKIRDTLRENGLEGQPVNIIVRDAVEYVMSLSPESIDILFVDIEKNRYPRMLEESIFKVRHGGLIMFHNALFPPPPRRLYDVIRENRLKYTIIPSENGILIVHRG